MTFSNFLKNAYAFFDPTKAFNEEGYLVEANGFFDTGNGSTDYVTLDSMSAVEDFFYGHGSGNVANLYNSPVNSSDVVADNPVDVLNSFNSAISDYTLQQQDAAQSSADRAMEFSAEQAQINRDFNAEQAQLNRDWQAEQNQKAMDYQTEMSNTAYQRAMADMQAAGINTKLVAQLGGASSPSGITSSGSFASGSAASGQVAAMSAANLAPLASVVNTYITGADALDRNQNDFSRGIIQSLFSLAGAMVLS